MNWNLTENGDTLVPGNFLIAAIYDPAAPTIVVQSVVLPQPYTSTKNFSFTGLAEQIWNFILWENTTATVGGSARNSFSLQPTQNTTLVRADLKLKAGVSVNMAIGDNTYVADTPNDLTGWQYDVERKPQGTQYEAETIAIDTNGFHLLVAGDLFSEFEEFVLHFLPQTASTAPPPTTTGIIVAPQVITGDIVLDNTFTGKIGLIQGATSNLTVTLPLLSTMANNKVIGFNSAGGSHLSAIHQCAGSDTILWSGGALGNITQLVLGQNQQLQLFKANDAGGMPRWNILSISDAVRMVGEIVYDYTLTKLDTTFADGGERDWNDYAWLRNYVQQLPGSQLATEAAWGSSSTVDGVTYFVNKAKYTLGDGSTFFRVPQLFNYGFLRAVNGSSRTAADMEVLQMLRHKHPTSTGLIPGGPNGEGPALASNGRYFNQQNQPSDLTGLPYNDAAPGAAGVALTRIGTQNRPDNTGVYALIRT